MDRLGLLIYLAAGTGIPGALVILVLWFGYYSAAAIFGAAILGGLIAWPVSRWAAKKIKREDPEWDARRERPQTPPPGTAPEKF